MPPAAPGPEPGVTVVPFPALPPVPGRPPRWARVWAASDALTGQIQGRPPVLRIVR
jgi:hypothetical protein